MLTYKTMGFTSSAVPAFSWSGKWKESLRPVLAKEKAAGGFWFGTSLANRRQTCTLRIPPRLHPGFPIKPFPIALSCLILGPILNKGRVYNQKNLEPSWGWGLPEPTEASFWKRRFCWQFRAPWPLALQSFAFILLGRIWMSLWCSWSWSPDLQTARYSMAGAGAQTCRLNVTPWLTASWLTLDFRESEL